MQDDTNSSPSERDQEHATNLCLMADFDTEEVFDFESVLDFSYHKELEQVFDNLLNDSYILTQKCVHVKEQISYAQKEIEKLRMDNEKPLSARISFQTL